MKAYVQLGNHLLKNPQVKDAQVESTYNELGLRYQVIQKIIEQRITLKMSQKDLAHRVGTQQSAISRLESGSSNPSLEFLRRIAAALGTELSVSFRLPDTPSHVIIPTSPFSEGARSTST